MRTFTRRKFLLGTGAGLGLSPLLKLSAAAAGPIIVCSRGEEWGRKVLLPAWQTLQQTGSILDAVEKGANVAELDPDDHTVGYGGYPNEDGVVQLDASIMYGPTHRCGSVMALENIKTPSSVARRVMERTDHIQLVGAGAKRFALMHGFKEENLLTDEARLAWLKWKENLSDQDDWLPPADGRYDSRPTGTINVLGIGPGGDVAGVTTTSGLAWKISGRVGDSPIIGAGLYVDNEVGAAGATGRGEEVIRTCGSFLVVELMRAGKSPEEACLEACRRIVKVNGGPEKVNFNVKFIAINKTGEIGCASLRESRAGEPSLSCITSAGFRAFTGRVLLS